MRQKDADRYERDYKKQYKWNIDKNNDKNKEMEDHHVKKESIINNNSGSDNCRVTIIIMKIK